MGYELTQNQQLNLETAQRRTREGGSEARSERIGEVRGHNYTFWPDTVRLLKRDGRVDEALTLLLECVDAAERDAPLWGGGIAPWYTEAAAIVYRQRRDYAAEVAILERYERNHRPRRDGVFRGRLVKARALLAKAAV